MPLIQGIPVLLIDREQIGTDALNAPIWEERSVTVDNVLVFPDDTGDITQDTNLRGKHSRYTLCIPKEDAHNWENREVEFFDHRWKTVGFPEEWISGLVPLGWNRRVTVERYG